MSESRKLEIRHLYDEEGLSTRNIASRLGLAKSTVEHYLKATGGTRTLSQAWRLACEKGRRSGISPRRGTRLPKRFTTAGYIEVYVLEKTEYAAYHSMVNCHGYILEHRLIMAQMLGRTLHKWEVVHHRNGVRHDNRGVNLLLVIEGGHNGKITCPFCKHSFGVR